MRISPRLKQAEKSGSRKMTRLENENAELSLRLKRAEQKLAGVDKENTPRKQDTKRSKRRTHRTRHGARERQGGQRGTIGDRMQGKRGAHERQDQKPTGTSSATDVEQIAFRSVFHKHQREAFERCR